MGIGVGKYYLVIVYMAVDPLDFEIGKDLEQRRSKNRNRTPCATNVPNLV